MDYKKIGTFIASLRKEKGLTQIELSNKLHITDRAISKWERGKGCPDISLLEDLSNILDVSIMELLKGERVKKKDIVNNDELINSMNYASLTIKEKINNIINIVVATIVILTSLFIIFNNIKIMIYENYTYYHNTSIVGDNDYLFDLDDKIEIISNNRGDYSRDEYKTIMTFINEMKKLDIETDKKSYNKISYSLEDIKEFVNSDNLSLLNNSLEPLVFPFERILKDHDIEDVEFEFVNPTAEDEYELKKFFDNYYLYDYDFEYENDLSNHVTNIIYLEYSFYNKVLDKLIEGGNLDA